MAISDITPPPPLFTIEEAVALLRDTGHPAPDPTLRRWLAKAGVTPSSRGRAARFSMDDVFLAHRDNVRARRAG